MAEPDLMNVLSKLQPLQGDVPVAEVEPTLGKRTIMMDAYDPNAPPPKPGQEPARVTIYSTTGQPRSADEFERAMRSYEASKSKKEAPKGYTVLEPGFQQYLRSKFEAVNQPLQQGAPVVGARLGSAVAPTGFTSALERYGLLPQGTTGSIEAGAQRLGAQEAGSLAEMVNTPGKAAMTAAELGLTGLAAPLTKASRAGKVVPALGSMLGNLTYQALGPSLAATIADVATGKSPDLIEAGTNLVIAGAAGGIQQVVGGILSNYIGKDRQRQVAENVLGEITKSYPGMVGNPQILERFAGSEKNLAKITGHLSSAIRGSVDDVGDALTQSIGQIGKMNLTVAQQNTFRSQSRRLALAGQEMLDAVELGKTPHVDTSKKFADIQNEMRTMVSTANLSTKNKDALMKQLNTSLAEHDMGIIKAAEGTQLLRYMKESGQGSGWNVNKFADAVRGETTQPGSLLERVSKQLGFNMPGGLGVGQTAAERRAEIASQAAQAALLPPGAGIVAKGVQALRNLKTPAPNTLPWQKVKPTPLNAGAVLYGQETLRDFYEPQE